MKTSGARGLTAFVAGGDLKDSVFRELVEALPVAIYTTDAEGRLTYFNRAAVKLSGRVPEIGTDKWCVTLRIFLPDGTYLPHDQCPMAAALKGAEVPSGIEYMAERPDGTRFWFSPSPAVMRDIDGNITGGINLLMDITDRKNAEIEGNEQFRAIVETTPECVKIVAYDGTVLFMNASGLAMVGASSAAAVIGSNVYDLIADPDRERFQTMNKRVCNGEKASLEFDLVRFDGSSRHMETHAAPLRYSDGTIVNVSVTRDITERRRAEQGARLLSAVIASSDDAIISKSLDGVITSWNKAAERIFGYTSQEAIGRTIAELLIPEDRQEEEVDILARLRKGERVDHFETVRRRKDGTLLDVSLTISPVKDDQGHIVGASRIARNISDRKQREQRFRQLAEAGPQIGWLSNAQGELEFVNRRWIDFSGLDLEAMRDPVQVASRLHPDDDVLGHWRESVAAGTPFEMEARLRGKNGEFRWFMMRSIPVKDEQGRVERWFGTSTDIHETKLLQFDLQRANRDLEQFAFSASHDLQEPLRSVKVYSELLANRYANRLDDDANEFITYLRNGATRMETLLHDLLAYTQAAKLERTADITDARQALDAALSNLSSAISETGGVVTSEPLPSVPMDATHLQQLFQNLIGNAIKYRSPERQPVVHVAAERQGEDWVFAVTDNGIGIDPAYKETIFGLFKRLHTVDEYSGTGIGLALCQRIVDRYLGRIWVESEPGRGSTFRFTLPG